MLSFPAHPLSSTNAGAGRNAGNKVRCRRIEAEVSGATLMDDWTPRRPWWRKKRWAVALLLWLLGAYPLSYGPAFGFWWRTDDPRFDRIFLAAYDPMQTLRLRGPDPARDALGRYLDLWLPEGWDEPIGCCLGLPESPPSGGPGEGVAADAPE